MKRNLPRTLGRGSAAATRAGGAAAVRSASARTGIRTETALLRLPTLGVPMGPSGEVRPRCPSNTGLVAGRGPSPVPGFTSGMFYLSCERQEDYWQSTCHIVERGARGDARSAQAWRSTANELSANGERATLGGEVPLSCFRCRAATWREGVGSACRRCCGRATQARLAGFRRVTTASYKRL